MNNPFECNYLHKDVGGTFADFILNQIKECPVGVSIFIDNAGRDVIRTRSALRVEAMKINAKFTTKTNDAGDLWAKRVL